MSRTMKDEPAWIYAEHRVSKVDRESAGSRRRGTTRDTRAVKTWEWHSCWRTGVTCDIDNPENLYRGVGRSRHGKSDRRLHCERRFYRESYGHGCPPWMRQVYEAIDRRDNREQCARARHEWNSWGEVQTYPATDQHRHGGAWNWD